MEEETKTKGTYDEKQVVIFNLGNEEFGVDINDVREIIKLEDITKIPNTEAYIDGVINLRGKIIVIIDLAKKLSLKTNERNKDTRIIVIEVQNSSVGMVVDSCNEVLRISTENIEKAPDIVTKKVESKYIEGVAMLKERLIILLTPSKILNLEEIKKVENIA